MTGLRNGRGEKKVEWEGKKLEKTKRRVQGEKIKHFDTEDRYNVYT